MGADLNIKSKRWYNYTALLIATELGHIDLVRYLIKKK